MQMQTLAKTETMLVLVIGITRQSVCREVVSNPIFYPHESARPSKASEFGGIDVTASSHVKKPV